VKVFIQLLFMIGYVLFFDMAFSNINSQKINISDDMIVISSGKFKMGCNQFGPMHGAPEHFVYLNEFMIDRFEVSNKKYEEIVPDHKLRRSKLSKCDKCPVTNVSWYEAVDFCYLTGKTLPTGNGDGCAFPWGYDFNLSNKEGRGGFEMRDKTAPIGSYPPNNNGVFDMGGNVWEWVSDWMAPSYQVLDDLIDPRGPNSGIMKVRRGGAYSDSIKAMAIGYRDWSHPSSRYFSDIGFRCAINVKR
jgi:formylglycine-generating enzyme required for sulfatase activity